MICSVADRDPVSLRVLIGSVFTGGSAQFQVPTLSRTSRLVLVIDRNPVALQISTSSRRQPGTLAHSSSQCRQELSRYSLSLRVSTSSLCRQEPYSRSISRTVLYLDRNPVLLQVSTSSRRRQELCLVAGVDQFSLSTRNSVWLQVSISFLCQAPSRVAGLDKNPLSLQVSTYSLGRQQLSRVTVLVGDQNPVSF